jgi:hypothetical protein
MHNILKSGENLGARKAEETYTVDPLSVRRHRWPLQCYQNRPWYAEVWSRAECTDRRAKFKFHGLKPSHQPPTQCQSALGPFLFYFFDLLPIS